MSQEFVPSDQKHRIRVENELDTTFFVEAGAGTGKTRELVQRITNLIVCGVTQIDHIAAITFTEAAAAELKDRVRTDLERCATDRTLDGEKIARCRAALTRFDDASIQTLHSFAASLLRERPFEAGLPPNFEVVAQMEAGIDFERNWQEWGDGAMERKETASHLLTAMTLGLRMNDLKTAARLLHENYDMMPDRFEPVPPPSPRIAQAVVSEAKHIELLMELANEGFNDTLAAHAQRVVDLARTLSSMNYSGNAALSLLAGFGKLSCKAGRKQDWADVKAGVNGCTVLKQLLEKLEAMKCEELEAVRRAALMPLLEDLRSSLLNWVEQRRSDSKVDFHDLLVRTRDMLRDVPDVREHFQKHFTHILIDEFQDTDPIQAEIAFFLAADQKAMGRSALTEKDWRKLVTTPGKLFMVGDPKQSIYRFRRADIATVQDVGEIPGTDNVPLEQNFRSQEPVIAWVNAVFGRWMGDGKPHVQATYAKLSARWNDKGAVPPMGVHRFGEAVDEAAAQLRKYEASSIANVLYVIKKRQWQVRNAVTNTLHPARYCDICVLMPTRTVLPYIERALDEANIPYRIESESLIFGTQDVRELLSCLRAIDSPADRVALVAALRSTAFGCNDVELVEYLDSGGLLDYTSPGKADGPVSEAMQVLARYNEMRTWVPIDQLIEMFIRERRLAEIAFGRARPRERLRRLKMVAQQARAFSEIGERSLRIFADWMEQQMAEGSRMVEIPVPEADEDAVRIMTIHAAKGLEFPIVILAGIGGTGASRGNPVIFERDGGSVEVSLGIEGRKFVTSGYERAREQEKEMDEAEAVRLMYVATTRARDHLMVSLYRKATKSMSNALAAVIERFAGETGCKWDEIDCSQVDTEEIRERDTDVPNVLGTEADREKWITDRETVLEQASRKPAIAVTALAHLDKEEPERGEIYYRKGRGGTSLGRAVHSVLQSIDLATGKDLEEIARAQAAAEGIHDKWKEVAGLVRRGLNAQAVKRAVVSNKYHREVFVSVPYENVLVEGFIDLLFEEDGGLVVVDYKTDVLDNEEEEMKRQDRYQLQAGTYALTIEKATSKPVKEVVLLFLRCGKEMIVTNIKSLTAQSHQHIVSILNAKGGKL
jgi:ATP-dependent helicase/nuclease subunit A